MWWDKISSRNINDHKVPKHGIKKLLWLANIASLILIKLKKIKIANPVQTTPKIVAEARLTILIFGKTSKKKFWEFKVLEIRTGNEKIVARIVVKVAISIGE